MLPDDDDALMVRLQAGENRALDALMDRWQVPLRRFLFRYLRNEDDALDLAQESFVRVYCRREKFRAGAKFSTWLFAIALNLCRDRARQNKIRPVISLDEAAFAGDGEQFADEAEIAPNSALLRAEAASAVRAAVESLPEPLRMAVLLCEYEELSHLEAAAIVGCSPKAVETRLYRARQLLREGLQSHWL